ncbi:hypothetical protein KP509_36G006700 [Ceratopteris richardii]|uniref:RRM domain-containing protein n=1 Tax=Ceratopteris richardii TaxID=49495 RepID=A0A8T2QAJ3_CERRI|nr:hypothetical protein KP509_36G006700 [Ceratopteris richardii]
MAIPDTPSRAVNCANSATDLAQEQRVHQKHNLSSPSPSSASSPMALFTPSTQQVGKPKIENSGDRDPNPAYLVSISVNEDRDTLFNDHDQHHNRMRALEEYFSKLNPYAKEFVPPSCASLSPPHISSANGNKFNTNRKKKNGNMNKKRLGSSRLLKAQWDDSIRRTVYVSDIDHQVTEEQLAALFLSCGQVVDCRVCGDPNSVLRFAFVEFTDEGAAHRALSLAGTVLGYYPVRVLPSKTAIVPVNPTFLPQSEDEREMCARTIYCTNIDKKISQVEVKLFFERFCGKVARLRLLGEYRHSARIAFVEFEMAESAIAALNCSGAILGSLPIRVSPSKTPVRPCMTRSFMI